jgi:hypothetical protein
MPKRMIPNEKTALRPTYHWIHRSVVLNALFERRVGVRTINIRCPTGYQQTTALQCTNMGTYVEVSSCPKRLKQGGASQAAYKSKEETVKVPLQISIDYLEFLCSVVQGYSNRVEAKANAEVCQMDTGTEKDEAGQGEIWHAGLTVCVTAGNVPGDSHLMLLSSPFTAGQCSRFSCCGQFLAWFVICHAGAVRGKTEWAETGDGLFDVGAH